MTDSVEGDVFEGVEDAYRGAIEPFKSVNDLAKGFSNLEKMIGNSVRLPSVESSEETKTKFNDKLGELGYISKTNKDQLYQAIGKPETPDGYDIDPETFSHDYYTGMRDVAHKAGLSNEQMSTLLEYDKQGLEAMLEEQNTQADNTMGQLQKLYGSDLPSRLEGAGAYLEKLSAVDKEASEHLNELATKNPLIVKLLSDAYAQSLEGNSKLPVGAVSYGMSPSDAKQQIEEVFNNPEHPYHKGDKAEVARVNKLFRIKHGG